MPFDRSNDRKTGRAVALRLLQGAALAALLVCANTAAVRAGDDDPNQSVFSKVMGAIGLKNPAGLDYGIDYNERSPLVVPPSRDLPPPQSAAAPQVADWPKDPDIARRKQVAHEDRVGPHPDNVIDSSRALRPGELNDVPGERTGEPGRPTDPETSGVASNSSKKNIWDFDIFNSNKEQYATFTGEPARERLTDPPPGYLTPSPDQPYGIAPEQKAYKVPTVADRVEPTR